MFENLPCHDIQLTLTSMGHIGVGIAMCQDDAIELMTFILHLGVQL